MARIDPASRSYVLTAGGDFDSVANPVLEAVNIRLSTEKGSCFWDLDFGSELHTLRQAKVGPDILRRVEDLVLSALQPMVDAGELLDLEIGAELVTPTRVDALIRALDAAHRPLSFTHFVRVG